MVPEVHAKLLYWVFSRQQEEIQYFSFTTDLWSSSSMDSYMAITIHYIDSAWQQKQAVIHCLPFPGRHTSQRLCLAFQDIFSAWKLTDRLHVGLRTMRRI